MYGTEKGTSLCPGRDGRAKARLTRAEVAEAISRTSVPRAEIFVCTKWFPPEGLSEPGVDSETVYQDLRRSHDIFVPKIGYVDLVLIHNNRPGPIGRANHWKALVRAQKEGWIKDIGVSNLYVYRPAGTVQH